MPEPSPRRAGLPRWIRALGLTVAALVLLYLGGAFILSRFLDPEALATWLEPRLEKMVNRDVQVARVEVRFLPLGVRMLDMVVSDPTGLAPELARLQSLELRIDLLPLLHREVRVSRLVMEGLAADLRINDEGTSNFGDLSTDHPGTAEGAEPESEPGQRPFSLNLRSVRLSDSRVRYTDDRNSLTSDLESLRLRATVQRDTAGSWLFIGGSDGRLTAAKGSAATLLDDIPVGLTFDMGAGPQFESLRIRTGEASLDRLALTVTGTLENLKDPVRTVALELKGDGLSLASLFAALPDTVRERFPVEGEGDLAADLRVAGRLGPGTLPEVLGQLRLARGRLTWNGKALADALTADLTLNPEQTVQTRAQATVLGGTFSLDGDVSLADSRRMDLTLTADPDLSRIGSVVELPEGTTTVGRLDMEVRIAGPVGDLAGLRFDGEIRPSGLKLTSPSLGLPVEVGEGRIRLAGTGATFEDLPVSVGTDLLSVSAEIPDLLAFVASDVTPELRGSVRGARLDLTRLSSRPLADTTLTYGKVAFAKVGGRRVDGQSPEAAAQEMGLFRPDSLPFAGRMEVALDTVVDRQGRMTDVRAVLDFGPDFLRVQEASFQRYGGTIRSSGNLSLENDPAAPFSFSLQVSDLSAPAFLSETTPLGRFVKGRLNLQLDLVGTLDGVLLPDRPALVGSGSFTLLGGGLATVPLTQRLADFLGVDALREPTIRDWGASFVLENGRVRLDEATIQGAPGDPTVGGTVGLDGALDLRSVFDFPTDRLNTAALERLGIAGQIAANVAQRPEVVEAVLHIGGSLLDPTIQADPAAMARTLGQAVKEEVRGEAQAQIDSQRVEAERIIEAQKAEAQRKIDQQKEQLQQRATGFLRGLIQRRDTARGDTMRPDTLRPDTIHPDTTRPDTTRPDTVRPDTTRPDTTRPDTVRPDTIHPDTTRPDTTRPGTVRPDFTRPETTRRRLPSSPGGLPARGPWPGPRRESSGWR